MNNKYPVGLLLVARTTIRGQIIKWHGKKEIVESILIPRHSCVMLLEYIRSFKEEDISFLWDNKIVFCTDIDLEHHFNILA